MRGLSQSSHEKDLSGADTIYFNFTNNGLSDPDTLAIRFLPKYQKVAIMNGVFNKGSKTVTNDGFVTISLEDPYSEPSRNNSIMSHSYKIKFLSNDLSLYANGKEVYSIKYTVLSEDPSRFLSSINGFTTSENIFWKIFNCSESESRFLCVMKEQG